VPPPRTSIESISMNATPVSWSPARGTGPPEGMPRITGRSAGSAARNTIGAALVPLFTGTIDVPRYSPPARHTTSPASAPALAAASVHGELADVQLANTVPVAEGDT
jgi:hypothetical protein